MNGKMSPLEEKQKSHETYIDNLCHYHGREGQSESMKMEVVVERTRK